MTEPNRNQIEQAIAQFIDPDLDQSYIDAGCIEAIDLYGDNVRVEIQLGFPNATVRAERIAAVRERVEAVEGVSKADIRMSTAIAEAETQMQSDSLDQIRNIIAVASAKGGVGKSTTAANIALGLRAEGARVAVLDADIYGPSQPQMLGITGKPESPDGKTLIPMENHGIKAMSIGFLVDTENPMVWRGPMVTQALEQLLYNTRWGEIDYLVVDLPPGTGDIQLTLAQKVPLSGAVIVSTPQEIALLDARKGLKMFEKVSVPVLGVVENMSIHICSNCGQVEPIFGEEGGVRMAEDNGVRLLGQLPLQRAIRTQADSGEPTVIADPDSQTAVIYREVARRSVAGLTRKDALPKGFPNIKIAED